jgi:hypothetical protein
MVYDCGLLFTWLHIRLITLLPWQKKGLVEKLHLRWFNWYMLEIWSLLRAFKVVLMLYVFFRVIRLPVYEDGTDRVFQNVGI